MVAENDAVLRVHGLSNADRMELREYLPDMPVDFQRDEPVGEQLGEPFTIIAVTYLSAMALKGLVAFLATQAMKEARPRATLEVEVIRGGQTQRMKFTVEGRTDPMTPELARALADVTDIPIKDLLQ